MSKKYETIPELVNIKGKGECFGYDGLMKKLPRSSTTIAVEDTDLFVLSESDFEKCFSKSILKSEIERKEFLMERIPAFKERRLYFDLRFKYIRTHVRSLIILMKKKSISDVLYTEGSTCVSVWLVYLGECVLLKNHKKLKSGEKLNNSKQNTIINISVGGFSGLEALNSGSQKYLGTLVVSLNIHITLD